MFQLKECAKKKGRDDLVDSVRQAKIIRVRYGCKWQWIIQLNYWVDFKWILVDLDFVSSLMIINWIILHWKHSWKSGNLGTWFQPFFLGQIQKNTSNAPKVQNKDGEKTSWKFRNKIGKTEKRSSLIFDWYIWKNNLRNPAK